MTILEAIADPMLFGGQFAGDSWRAWKMFLSAMFGLRVEGDALATFTKHTGRESAPEKPFSEAYAIVGRRGGKSRIAALVGVYLACFRDYSGVLAHGERGVVMLIAPDRRQARVVMGYVRGLLGVPLLAGMVERERREAIELNNRIVIEVHTASYRAVRGYTVVACIADELAFWRSEESADPDIEILRAVRPAMATVPGALLLGISSPYSRRGALWQAYRKHFGEESSVLVWQAATELMNPTVDEKIIADAYETDPVAASAEYGALFRTDVETFISVEAIEAVTAVGRAGLPYVGGVKYHAFTDPSGGSRDSFTLAIAHAENGVAVLDCVRERKAPFSPESVVTEFADALKAYRVRQVEGDRYAGEWPREQFAKHGIEYIVAKKAKSDIYAEWLPACNSQKVELLDHKVLAAQLCSLERRTGRGGRDSIDHPPKGRDDVANAAAGALVRVLFSMARKRVSVQPISIEQTNPWDDGSGTGSIRVGGMDFDDSHPSVLEWYRGRYGRGGGN